MGTSPACAPPATRTASNLGVPLLPEPRSPWRYCRRQANTWLAFTPCARATRATDARGARVSSKIWRFSSGLRCRLLASVGVLREDIPTKRTDHRLITYLTRVEIDAAL